MHPASCRCAASIDEDFEKWCEELHEALEKRSDLVGAQADQKADESVNGVAAYDVQVSRFMVWLHTMCK